MSGCLLVLFFLNFTLVKTLKSMCSQRSFYHQNIYTVDEGQVMTNSIFLAITCTLARKQEEKSYKFYKQNAKQFDKGQVMTFTFEVQLLLYFCLVQSVNNLIHALFDFNCTDLQMNERVDHKSYQYYSISTIHNGFCQNEPLKSICITYRLIIRQIKKKKTHEFKL